VDPDLPLVQALQSGDDSGLSELMRRHRDGLFHFVFRYVQNEAAAQDIVQETFVRCYFKAAKFKPQATFKTWLYAIALNLSRDYLRHGLRRPTVSSDELNQDDGSKLPIVDPNALPDEQAAVADRHRQLQEAINRLPEKLREPLILYALEQKSQQEVADILGTNAKTVELRVYHAKTKLRKLLGHLLGRAGSAVDSREG